MCLISVLPKGTIKYNEKVEAFVKQGMSCNTDGSGFMYKREGPNEVFIHKGFMKLEELLSALKALKLGLKDELVIHHRIKTSGKVDAVNMHPFVLSDKPEILQSVKGAFNLPIMAHNGVFSHYSDYHSDFSDTYHFVEKLMSTSQLIDLLGKDHKKFSEIFEKVLGSNKLAFLFPNRDIILLGNFVEDDGYYHSHNGYKEYVYDRGGRQTVLHNNKYNDDSYDNDYYWDQHLQKEDAIANNLLRKTASNQVSTIWIDGKPVDTPKHGNIKLLPSDILLTKENAKHFMFRSDKDLNTKVNKNTIYIFEQYDSDVMVNYVAALKNSTELYGINTEVLHKFLDESCILFVRNEYKEIYQGLYNLILRSNRNPSQSLMKLISKTLNKKVHLNTFKFKEYGVINWYDLSKFYNNYKKAAKTPKVETSTTLEKELDDLLAAAKVPKQCELLMLPEC